MSSSNLSYRVKRVLIFKIILPINNVWLVLKYKFLSTCTNVNGKPTLIQPLLAHGLGKITIGERVRIGLSLSPYYLNTYCHLEVRKEHSEILIGNDVWINNNACIISEGEGIIIGSRSLIGMNFCAFDSDFHQLEPNRRVGGNPRTAKINIGANVFIGANVTILKGVSIGENSIIGSGSIVTHSIPSNSIAAGNPCQLIKAI